MIGIRKRLQYAVVGNRNGRHPPLVSPFHDILHLGHAVHIAHFCVTVQFYPLSDAVVHPSDRKIRDLFYPRNGRNAQLMVKLVRHRDTFDLQEIPFLQKFFDLSGLFCLHKDLHADGIRQIRDRKNQNGLFDLCNLTLIKIQHFPADDHFADLIGDILDG